jgi:hypothetical protein
MNELGGVEATVNAGTKPYREIPIELKDLTPGRG